MHWSIDNSALPAYLHVKVDGPLTTEALSLMCNSILASEHWERGIPILLDNGNTGQLQDHGSASEMIANALRIFEDLSRSIPSSCIAVLIGPDADFVSARQLQYALIIEDLSTNIQIFFTEEEAVKWIGHCDCDRREGPPCSDH